MDSLALVNKDWDDGCNTSLKMSQTEREEPEEAQKLEETTDYTYELYPNLTQPNRYVNIRLRPKETGRVHIYSLTGKLKGEYELHSGSNELSLGRMNLSNGIFLYSVQVDGELENRGKLVIVK